MSNYDKQIFQSLKQMEEYLKRIANEPQASATTPLGSTSPGRSKPPTYKSDIFPDTNRVFKQAATGTTGSTRARQGSTSGVAKGAVEILLDSSKLNPARLYLASKAMVPFGASLREFINTIGDLEKGKAENISKISGIGDIIHGLRDLDKLDPNKASKNLSKLSGGVRDFVMTITDIDKRRSDKVRPVSYISQILNSLKGVLDVSVGQIVAAKVFLPMLANTIKVFADTIGKINTKKANEAISVIPKMGLSLLAFTGSIALAALAVGAVALDPLKFLGIFAIMAATGLAFNIIGKNNKDINKGSLATAGMGLGLLAFAGGLAIAAAVAPPISQVLPLALTLTAFGGVFYLAGKLAPTIALGALAMGAVGLATWLISKPIETIAGVLGQNPAAIWQIPLMITGIGAAFALAGIGPVPLFIGAGALALGVAGGALWVLSKGLSNLLTLPTITKEKAAGIEMAIRSVVTGFGKSFQDLSLKESLTLPLKIPMVGLMGVALFGLASGISSYQAKAGNFGPKDSENLKNTISGLSEAFATAGSTEGMSKLFGFNVGQNDVERGIESTMKLGKNLKNLADGVMAWKKMPLTPADVQQVSDNVQRVLNVIPGIFAGVGKADAGSTGSVSFLGLSFENPFSKGDTERGISATMEMGENLKNLADGVMAWKDGGKAGFNSADLPGITSNIQNILAAIPGSFAQLGKADRETSGIFPWSDGDIENGIELAEGLGPSLQSIASLLESVKTGNMEKATASISANIPVLLKSYALALNDFSNFLEVDPDDVLEQISEITDTFVEVSDSTGKINTELGKLGDLAEPLEKVAKAMTSVNTAMKGQFDLLNKENQEKLKLYSTYYSSVSDVAKSNPIVLKQNLDAVVKSGFSSQQTNDAFASQRVSVTNQMSQPPKVNVNVPKTDMSAQEKVNAQILEALQSIAKLLVQTNGTNIKTTQAVEELAHVISGGIKIKEGLG